LKDAKGSPKVEVYIYAFDSDGIVRDRLYQALNLDLRKVGDKLKTTGLKYYGTLSLPPGKYAVKSLVRTVDNDRRGFARTDIVIPKPGDAAGFSVVPMEEQAKWVMVKGESHAANAAYPFVLNGNQFFPTTVARKNGEPQKVALFVYGARTQDLTWQTTPKTTFLGRADGAGDGAAALVLQLDPADASAGALDIKVSKKGSTDSKTVTVPISE